MENETHQGHSRPPLTRNRAQLSCTPCRHSKLKCDRNQPCGQCLKKCRGSSCTFPARVPRRQPPVSMQNRLQHLESLVKDVISGQSLDERPTSSNPSPQASVSTASIKPSMEIEPEDQSKMQGLCDNSQPSVQYGQVLVGSKEATYVGATHWAAILEDIEEVKDYFEGIGAEDAEETEQVTPYANLTFNSEPTTSKHGLLAALPEKSVVDRLVSKYFNSSSPSLTIIHKPTFQKQFEDEALFAYAVVLFCLSICITKLRKLKGPMPPFQQYVAFWECPTETSVNWIALLFSLIYIGTIASFHPGAGQPDGPSTPLETIQVYKNCCIQALILSKYTKPGLYTIETLVLYMEGEFILGADDQVHLYLLVGNAVRLCLRMGLHRDSANISGNITPFQAEFRRRIWHHLAQIDLLSSFIIGLPGMVEGISSDTRYPRNLRDDDFDEDSVALPPSRPESEITPTSYLICKSRLSHECGKVATLANNMALPSHEHVLKLDRLLQEGYAKVPLFYRVSSSGFSVTDSPGTVTKQFSLFLLFHKSRCMLHRRYVTKANNNPEYLYSRKIALDASLELLKGQSMGYDAARPGGPLAHDRWFVSSVPIHDFLLAAMIVCMEVMQSIKGGLSSSNIFDLSHREDLNMITVLEKSYKIWTEMSSSAADARKASLMLKSILKKINSSLQGQSGDQGTAVYVPHETLGFSRANLISVLSFDDTSGLSSSNVPPSEIWNTSMSNGAAPSSSLGLQHDEHASEAIFEPSGSFTDSLDNFDWDNFDTHIWPRFGSSQSLLTSNLDGMMFGELDYPQQ